MYPPRQTPEQGSRENWSGRGRSKGGLEAPLKGRLIRERYLIFAPPLWYDLLIAAVAVGGFGSAALALVGKGPAIGILGEQYCLIFGSLFGLAALWAALTNERMSIDIRKGTYARLEGQQILRRVTRGSVSELYGIALMTSQHPLRPIYIYRLVLYWNANRHPLLVIQSGEARIMPGRPINYGAGQLHHVGQQWSRYLNIQYADASSHLSPDPLRAIL